MKRLITGIALLLSVLIFVFVAKAVDEDMEEQKKRLEEAKIAIDNVDWKIKLNPIGETKARAYEDTLSFTDGKVSAESLESQGFSPSNYTVSLKGEDVIVWETMQSSEEEGLAFWHGELEDDVMRGVLSKHPDEKTHIDFSFYSTEKKELKPKPVRRVEEIKKEPAPEPVKPKTPKVEEAPEEVTPTKEEVVEEVMEEIESN